MQYAITSTIKLSHCWVCESGVKFNEHHVIPQAYGGARGPTVTLCADHHDLLHEIADISNEFERIRRIQEHALRYEPRLDVANKLFYLVTRVVLARAATTGSVNKVTKMHLSLTGEEMAMLRWLKQALGCPSQEALVKMLVRERFQQMMGNF